MLVLSPTNYFPNEMYFGEISELTLQPEFDAKPGQMFKTAHAQSSNLVI